jgi:mono/diheme cytochrome c family protein
MEAVMKEKRALSGTTKIFMILVGLVIYSGLVLPLAISAGPKPSETKGRHYFRENCKTCHTKGAAGGEITPLSKTQAQWKLYFTAGKHNRRTEPLNKLMSDDQVQDVQAYLIAHAADSPQPETCGK